MREQWAGQFRDCYAVWKSEKSVRLPIVIYLGLSAAIVVVIVLAGAVLALGVRFGGRSAAGEPLVDGAVAGIVVIGLGCEIQEEDVRGEDNLLMRWSGTH